MVERASGKYDRIGNAQIGPVESVEQLRPELRFVFSDTAIFLNSDKSTSMSRGLARKGVLPSVAKRREREDGQSRGEQAMRERFLEAMAQLELCASAGQVDIPY